ncbi:hypothetical protein pb186bvf_018262 [Paramecium bursaria]
MSELEEFESTLNSELDKLQKEIDTLSKKEYNQRNQAIKRCTDKIKSIATLIESFELEIGNVDRNQAQRFIDSLKAINQRYGRLKNELEFKKNENSTQENLFKEKQQRPADLSQMTAQQAIDEGDQTQAKAMNALANIITTVDKGNELADQISAELDKQISQLDRMYDTVKDTQTTLKRTAKYIKYFARQVYTDKLLMCLMGAIFLAILTLVILSALGIKPTGGSTSKGTTTVVSNSTATR